MMNRRAFVKITASAASGCLLTPAAFPAIQENRRRSYKAAIIGRTGGGDYGHGYDTVFKGLDNVSVEAIADADPEGLKKAAERSGARRHYADYRVMLDKERPDIVCIAPRQPDCHKAMALAAIELGSHVFIEKPMTESVEEADAILQAAEKKKAKIAVAHVRRYTADFQVLKALLDEGFLGEIREFRVEGKQDNRAGGEDLIVLGTHDFDLLRFYFGDPLWCFANVRQDGRDAVKEDVHRGREPIWVAGDTIFATFAFPKNIQAAWSSIKTQDHWNTNFSTREKWAFTIFGSRRTVVYQSGFGFAYLDSPFLAHKEPALKWNDLPQPKSGPLPEHTRSVIKNLIHAIETDTQPLCGGYDGRQAVEMVAAIYQSHIRQARMPFPLAERRNPLLHWK